MRFFHTCPICVVRWARALPSLSNLLHHHLVQSSAAPLTFLSMAPVGQVCLMPLLQIHLATCYDYLGMSYHILGLKVLRADCIFHQNCDVVEIRVEIIQI